MSKDFKEVGHVDIQRKRVAHRRNSQSKGPKARTYQVRSRNKRLSLAAV